MGLKARERERTSYIQSVYHNHAAVHSLFTIAAAVPELLLYADATAGKAL